MKTYLEKDGFHRPPTSPGFCHAYIYFNRCVKSGLVSKPTSEIQTERKKQYVEDQSRSVSHVRQITEHRATSFA